MNRYTKNLIASLAVISIVSTSLVYAAPNVIPDVDLNSAPDSSKGAFRLVICDGPVGINHYDPVAKKYDLSTDSNGRFKYPPNPNPGAFIPCNFEGLMIQAQYLINAMMIVGVLAALVGFAYSGLLFMSGSEKKRSDAKEIFPKIFWGFVIMLTAWFVVYQILSWLTGNANNYLGATLN